MATRTRAMTIEEFMRRYSEEGPFELVSGEAKPVTPQTTRSGRVAGRLFRRLSDHVMANELGEVFIEVPFVMTETVTSNWVQGSRVPDIMFVQKRRLDELAAKRPDWEDGPLVLVPDFVAEVVSPTDRFSDVSRKVTDYLSDGVRLVWIVEPQQQVVFVYRVDSDQHTILTVKDMLDGGDIIPGVELPVAQLFEG